MAGNGTKLPTADMIQDITTRFVLTAPAEQLMFFESIMFLVEQAHWYYEDFVREQDSTLRSLSLKDFAVVVFENCPELAQHVPDIEAIMDHFKAFKKNVPVMGGILLDQDMSRVLLVKGWKNTACWGFPRGKIHKNETDAQCAVREVLEETGYDIEDLVNEDDFIELTLDGKRNKLFIVAGLDPDSAQFAPKCKGEIGGYAWHRIADLPATRDESNQTFLSQDGARHKFFMVWPYLKPLRKWIRKQQRDNPGWDMPLAGPTPEQHKTRSRVGGGSTSGGTANNSSAGRSPLPNNVLQLQGGGIEQQHHQQQQQQQRRSGGNGGGVAAGLGGGLGGGLGTGSPKKHADHLSFHEAAILQAQQAGLVSGGIRPGAVPAAPMVPLAAPPAAGSSGSRSSSVQGQAQQGRLAALFSGAAAAPSAAASSAPAAAAGGGSSGGACSHKNFRFNRQAILSVLEPSTGAGHPRSRLAAH